MGVALRTAQRWQEGELPRLGTLMELADKMAVERSYFVEDSGDRFTRLEELAAEMVERVGRIEDLLRDGEASPRSRRAPG